MAYVDISHSGLHLNLRFSCRMRRSGTRPVVLLVFVWPRRARAGLCRLCRIACRVAVDNARPARGQNMCRMPAITPS
ncbi:hypothetical protein C6T68_26670 [Burkholderia multivorans]|nr:hypothetical protein C6T68_26670 [Burkholderia multivorans]